MNSTAEYWKYQYINLTNTTVTKKDYTDLNSKIELIINKIDNQQTTIYNLQQSIVTINHVRNIYLALYFSLTLFSLTLVDFIFLRFKVTNWIVSKVYELRFKKTDIHIKK